MVCRTRVPSGRRVRPLTGARRRRSASAATRSTERPGAARWQATLRRQTWLNAILPVTAVEMYQGSRSTTS